MPPVLIIPRDRKGFWPTARSRMLRSILMLDDNSIRATTQDRFLYCANAIFDAEEDSACQWCARGKRGTKPMKKLVAAAVALLAVGMSASAFAETLAYDFPMTVTKISDATEPGYSKGIFASAGIYQGSTLNVSVSLNTAGNSAITVNSLSISTTNTWYGGSWSTTWTQGDGTVWLAGTGTGGGTLIAGSVSIPNGSATEVVSLTFAPPSNTLSSGWMTINIDNTVHASLRADYTSGPSSTPELDPSSGVAALALLLGGTIVFSPRSRRPISRS